jgi:hypothetical protein
MIQPERIEDELNYQINRRMKWLYREGCRRFRVVPLERTGDDIKFKVMGWPQIQPQDQLTYNNGP